MTDDLLDIISLATETHNDYNVLHDGLELLNLLKTQVNTVDMLLANEAYDAGSQILSTMHYNHILNKLGIDETIPVISLEDLSNRPNASTLLEQQQNKRNIIVKIISAIFHIIKSIKMKINKIHLMVLKFNNGLISKSNMLYKEVNNLSSDAVYDLVSTQEISDAAGVYFLLNNTKWNLDILLKYMNNDQLILARAESDLATISMIDANNINYDELYDQLKIIPNKQLEDKEVSEKILNSLNNLNIKKKDIDKTQYGKLIGIDGNGYSILFVNHNGKNDKETIIKNRYIKKETISINTSNIDKRIVIDVFRYKNELLNFIDEIRNSAKMIGPYIRHMDDILKNSNKVIEDYLTNTDERLIDVIKPSVDSYIRIVEYMSIDNIIGYIKILTSLHNVCNNVYNDTLAILNKERN